MRSIVLVLAILAAATKYCLAEEKADIYAGIPYVDRALCIEQNSFDLDDGISGADVIGKSVAVVCRNKV